MRYLMRRCRRLTLLLTAALALAAGLQLRPGEAAPPRPAAAPARPNVLLVVLDDARPEAMAALPRTTEWLADGTAYPEAVAATPSCGPSRATLLTGRYAHNHGVLHQADIGALDHTATLQRTLHDAGYATAAVGKFTNGWKLERTPPGFDHSALVGGGYTNARFMVDGRQRRVPYSTTFIGEQVNRYLDGFEADDGKPWFVYASFTAPHAPYTPEARYAARGSPGSRAQRSARRTAPTSPRTYAATSPARPPGTSSASGSCAPCSPWTTRWPASAST
ncbi:sulfatase-like hydrolase/transferase [Catellatospora bangladeshensis]|uniref:sulfatase-like hydrolase/transferase n=1 Tax=Catellatospora bangladeshensis TaxID=310355 RepID=UPI00360F14C3